MKRIEKFAEAHHGLIRPSDAAALGVSKVEFYNAARNLERIARSVYRVPGSVPTWQQRLLGVVWASGRGAVASHRSAAALWRLPGFAPGALEVCRARHSSGRVQGTAIRETS